MKRRIVVALLVSLVVLFSPVVLGQKKGGLKATATAHSVSLTWVQGVAPNCTPTACPVTSNTVYRGTTSGGETLLSTSTTPIVAYTDTTVVGGLTYFYKVSATNINGEGPRSVEVSATIPNPLPPAAPTGLTAVPQ